MIKKFIYLITIPSILLISSCATTKTAQRVDQNDDVYYSITQAKEAVEVMEQPKNEKSDYVTDNELYGDSYNHDYYGGDYSSRIYRFRNYLPSLGYYNSLYGFNYDPFYSDIYSPYSYYGRPMFGLSFGVGSFYNYNPWRYYGNNYGSNYWGPYSYYNSWNPYGYGYGGYYGNNYGSGRAIYTSPNYRARPVRSNDNIRMNGGSYTDGSGGVIRNGNGGNVINSRGRAERYGDNTTGTTHTPARTQTTTRPERVQREPRTTTPERIMTAPRDDRGSQGGYTPSNGGSSGGGRSGGETGGARPSRGN